MYTFHHALDMVKTQLMDDVVKRIVPGKDYLFRLDTQTEHFPRTDELVYTVRCRAEELEGSIENPRIILPKQFYCPYPKDVIFHPPATIVYWEDGEKTIVKCMEGDEFSPEVGLAMCLAKYIFGKRYKKWFRDGMKKGRWQK